LNLIEVFEHTTLQSSNLAFSVCARAASCQRGAFDKIRARIKESLSFVPGEGNNLPRITAAFLLLLMIVPKGFSWGREGHRVIADIAEHRLNSTARTNLETLIGTQKLASVANWADEVRGERDETYNWHFVDIPSTAAGFDHDRDCWQPNSGHQGAAEDHHNCVVDRITIFEEVLANPKASRPDRVEALKFLVHFVGDVHQPFHAIGDARGGNDIQVREFGRNQCGQHTCNLHGAWDTGVPSHNSGHL
jgi:hypothetical protein